MKAIQDFKKLAIEKGRLDFASDPIHLLRLLVTEQASLGDLSSIDYKNSLLSGIRLEPNIHFTNDGLIDKVIYTWEGREVLCITEKYEYNPNHVSDPNTPISKYGIKSRIKTWEYFFTNGDLDTSDRDSDNNGEERLSSKDKSKTYNNITGREVGEKRRSNITIILSEKVGTMLVVLGIFNNSSHAFNEMRKIANSYSGAFSQFEKYGSTFIFKKINEDTKFDWLNTNILSNEQIDQAVSSGSMSATQAGQIKGAIQIYGLEDLQGRSVREYFVEKLKGNLS